MHVQQIRTTSTGPALGEIVSESVLLDAKDEVLAAVRQRFRAWIGRPLLEMRIDLKPVQPPKGYPWHAYYGARFAWRDEKAALLRGVCGTGYATSHTRPETPDFLELRVGLQNTVIFPGGLPFHQRHGGRMLDVILLVEGEETLSFELAIGLDREQPMQTALGMVTPVAGGGDEQGTAARRRDRLAVPPGRAEPGADQPAACGRRRRRRDGPPTGGRRRGRPGADGAACATRNRPGCSTPTAKPCSICRRGATPCSWTWDGMI